jgi:hypothetical protein
LARLLPPDLLPELCRKPLADLLPALRAALPKVTDGFLMSEEFAAARGRIAAHYDGGLIVGD